MKSTKLFAAMAVVCAAALSDAGAQTWNIPTTSGGSTLQTNIGTTSSDDVSIITGGQERLKIFGTGSYVGTLRLASSNFVLGASGHSYINWASTGNLRFRTLTNTSDPSTGTTRLIITQNGDVGIGKTLTSVSPGLHIKQFASYGTSLWLDATDVTGGQSWIFQSTGGDNVQGAGKLLIAKHGAPGVSMTFAPEGNIGIGYHSTSPTTLLDLKKSGGASDRNVMLKLTNTYDGASTALNEPTILFDNGTTSTTYGSGGWSMGAQVAQSSAAKGFFRIGMYTNGSTSTHVDYLNIKNDGKVGIGTTNFVGNYKLYVKDGILTEKIKVASSGSINWSDFVFDKNYKLRPLSEVESFIKENHHLPEIPSAEEVNANGVDLLEMDAKLLMKVEELTLYMIELKKQNDEVKKENEELKRRLEKLEIESK